MKEEILDILSPKRSYASYFAFTNDKPGTELGIVLDWLDARYENPDELYLRLEHLCGKEDPPDVIAVNQQGESIGFEITELVDGKTIHLWKTDKSDETKEYDEIEFHTLILNRIHKKSSKPFRKECSLKILIIFSDEPALITTDKSEFPFQFPKVSQTFFDEIWFLTPPHVYSGDAYRTDESCRIYRLV